MFRIRFILMRIRGSASGKIDPDPNKFQFFSVQGLKRITMFFFVVIWAYYSGCISNKISDFFKKKLYSYNFGLFVCEFIMIFLYYPDPDQRFLKWIRIRPNDTDPTGSGFDTLYLTVKLVPQISPRGTFGQTQELLQCF